MITLQHSALFFLALNQKLKENYPLDEFRKEIPFVLLPDAIRAYIGPRQAGHFERTPDGATTSWMKFPDESTIRKLTKENASSLIQFHVVPNLPKCVIGEDTDVEEFDIMNWGHKHYNSLRIHLLQDTVLDRILREKMVDVSERFEDRFVINHNKATINGAVLRQQIALFENLGFIRLVGNIYNCTGSLLNKGWFERNLLPSLMDVYPDDLTVNTYKYMQLSPEVDDRITSKRFELSEEEKAELIITDQPERLMDEMYAKVYLKTFYEL